LCFFCAGCQAGISRTVFCLSSLCTKKVGGAFQELVKMTKPHGFCLLRPATPNFSDLGPRPKSSTA
jgi:hypothetical protein